MTLVNSGLDAMSCALGGDTIGMTGTATATTATSLTATSTPFVASSYIGHIVVASSTSGVLSYGVITANTTSVLTVERWFAPGSPGGAATTTPIATCTYTVLPGQAPYWYMALGTTHSIVVGDTTLTGEFNNSGGGLNRNIANYAHTNGTTTYTLGQTFTVNSSDAPSLPATIVNIGIFNTLTPATGRMLFETALTPSSATVSATGDAVTILDTVTV